RRLVKRIVWDGKDIHLYFVGSNFDDIKEADCIENILVFCRQNIGKGHIVSLFIRPYTFFNRYFGRIFF
ncbi:MAG: hypothetical protein K5664_01535, partial [Firmicutes bacterium]|nr:hypothetical protein [Bacillota bacterium]